MKKLTYLIAPIASLLVFIIWTILVKIVDVHYIQSIGFLGFYNMNTHFMGALQNFDTHLFDKLTDVLLYISLASVLVIAGFGVYQLIKRKSLKNVDPIIYFDLCGYVLMVVMYFIFELVKINYGPTSTPDKLKASYPSSHVFIFMVVMGLGLLTLLHYKNNKTMKIICYAEFGLLSILMAMLRSFSGQHYLSDIFGGVFLGFVLVTTIHELVRYYFKEIKQEENVTLD